MKVDENLAEFIGIILGDGHIGKHKYEVSVTSGENEGGYSIFISGLIEKLFNKTPFIYSNKSRTGTCIRCKLYSKEISEFLTNEFGLPKGRKIDVKIPEAFFGDKELLKSCVRGLVDTDGSVSRHHKNSIQMEFSNKDGMLLESVSKALKELGLKVCRSNGGNTPSIYLFGDMVVKYFKEVGTNNPKHGIKFRLWEETGIVPKNKDILSLLFKNNDKRQ